MERLEEKGMGKKHIILIDNPVKIVYCIEDLLNKKRTISLGRDTEGDISVGRIPDVSLALNKTVPEKLKYVSRVHCNLFRTGRKKYLQNNSGNGTTILRNFKNKHGGLGTKIFDLEKMDKEECLLKDGDKIYLGRSEEFENAYGPILYTEKPEGEEILFPSFML